MLENEEPGKNTEKESLGENPRNMVSLKPREYFEKQVVANCFE